MSHTWQQKQEATTITLKQTRSHAHTHTHRKPLKSTQTPVSANTQLLQSHNTIQYNRDQAVVMCKTHGDCHMTEALLTMGNVLCVQ